MALWELLRWHCQGMRALDNVSRWDGWWYVLCSHLLRLSTPTVDRSRGGTTTVSSFSSKSCAYARFVRCSRPKHGQIEPVLLVQELDRVVEEMFALWKCVVGPFPSCSVRRISVSWLLSYDLAIVIHPAKDLTGPNTENSARHHYRHNMACMLMPNYVCKHRDGILWFNLIDNC